MVTHPFIVGLLRRCMQINVIWLSFILYRNPIKAFKSLKQLVKLREKKQKREKFSKLARSGGRIFWAINIPGWPSRAFNQFIINELLRKNNGLEHSINIQTVILGITSKCKLNCKHCLNHDAISENSDLNRVDLKSVVKKIEANGIPHIQFSGGEPLEVFDELIELIVAAREMDSWILTSGFGLTAIRASLLKRAGLTGANISLDHWDEVAHNKFRGNDQSYLWVSKAVQNCKQVGLMVSLSLCATREFTSKENLGKYIELAQSWGVQFIRILEPKESGRFKTSNIKLSGEQLKILEEFYYSFNGRLSNNRAPMVDYLDLLQRDKCYGKGDRFLYIDEYGDTHPCPFSLMKSGNILKDPFGEIKEKLSKAECVNCNLGQLLTPHKLTDMSIENTEKALIRSKEDGV